MKIKFVTSYSTNRESFAFGKTYDFPDVEAQKYIGSLLAIRDPSETDDGKQDEKPVKKAKRGSV
jgi:hypothetical protein